MFLHGKRESLVGSYAAVGMLALILITYDVDKMSFVMVVTGRYQYHNPSCRKTRVIENRE
jgi:hypothetical protein